MKKREIYWFVGTLLFCFLLNGLFLYSNESELEGYTFHLPYLFIHVDSWFAPLLWTIPLVFSIVYFFRMLRYRFQNRFVNIVFNVFALCILILLGGYWYVLPF